MKFTTLMSGSKGNCTYIGSGKTHILVDMGCSLTYLRKALAGLSLAPEDMDAVIITHEHTDHIRGLAMLLKHYGIPIFAPRLTWEKLPCSADFPRQHREILGSKIEIGELELDFFPLSHDASQPIGLVADDGRYRLGLATDTGEITPGLVEKLKGADGLILEANYSPRLLEAGPYPRFLKKRIAGIKGHLSNAQCACCLKQVLSPKTQAVLLAHLSEVNNTPAHALSEVQQGLEGRGCAPFPPLYTAPNRQPHPLLRLA